MRQLIPFLLWCLLVTACKTTAPDESGAKGIIDADTQQVDGKILLRGKPGATYYWADNRKVYAVDCVTPSVESSAQPWPHRMHDLISVSECKTKFANTIRSLDVAAFRAAALRLIDMNKYFKKVFSDRKALNDFGGSYLQDLEKSIEVMRPKVSAAEYEKLRANLVAARERYAQVLTSVGYRSWETPTADPVQYVEALIKALQRPEDITVVNTHADPTVPLHGAVVDAVLNRLLPDMVRAGHQAVKCWDTFSLVVVDAKRQCQDFGFKPGDFTMLLKLEKDYFSRVPMTEIPDAKDQKKVWGGGYLLLLDKGTYALSIATDRRSPNIWVVDPARVAPRFKATSRFCLKQYPIFNGAGVQCGAELR